MINVRIHNVLAYNKPPAVRAARREEVHQDPVRVGLDVGLRRRASIHILYVYNY